MLSLDELCARRTGGLGQQRWELPTKEVREGLQDVHCQGLLEEKGIFVENVAGNGGVGGGNEAKAPEKNSFSLHLRAETKIGPGDPETAPWRKVSR